MSHARLWLLLAALTAPALGRAQDDDWSVARPTSRRRPRHPSLPAGTARPVARHSPASSPAASVDATRARRDRMIAALTQSALRSGTDDDATLAVLLRLVRERDGSIDALVADFETRARARDAPFEVDLALGHLYREAGRFDDALARYASAERIAPDRPAPALAMAALLQRMDRHADARAALERALTHTHDRAQYVDTLRRLVDASLAQGELEAARAFHRRLVAADPTRVGVRRELADALVTRGLHREAVAELRSLSRSLAGDNRVLPPVLRDLGRALAADQQYDEALGVHRRALALAGADAGVRRELYDAITEVHVARNTLPAWITELEHMGGGTDAHVRAMLLGRLHEQAGNPGSAITAYRRAVALRPGELDGHVRLAQLYHQQGMRGDEVATYRRLVVLSPRDPRVAVDLADLLLVQGQRDEAFRILAQASARAGSDTNVHERLAEVYARHGRQQDALREIELVARYDPSSPAGLAALGRQYMELGQNERALATWRRILDMSRDRARGAATLAEVYADNAMLEQAAEMYTLAIGLRPDELDYHRGLATVLERNRRFDPAETEWRRVIELARADRETRAHARESIVRLWGLRAQLPMRAQRLRAAFDGTPPDLEAGRDLAEVLARLHRSAEAVEVLRRIVLAEPSDVTSLVALDRALTQQGDLAGAIEVLQRLVAADPRRAREGYQRMAQHAMALHRDEQAIEFATRAVQLNDQDATAHLRLAELYRARNDTAHAMAALRRALELNDRLYATYFQLADLYLGYANRPDEAVALYRRVIALSPDDDDVLRAGRLATQVAIAAELGPELERALSAASAAAPARAVFRRLLVAYYDAQARPWIHRLNTGSAEPSAHARAQLDQLGRRALAPLLDALGDSDPAQQGIALDLLGYLGRPGAATALLAMAESPDPSGSARAATAHRRLQRRALLAAAPLVDARMVPRLAAFLGADDSWDLRVAAIWALGHVRGTAAVPVLIPQLAAGQQEPARTMAALALWGTTDARARAELQRVVRSDPNDRVRTAALLALAGAVEPADVPMLLAQLDAGPGGGSLREAAAVALGLRRDERAVPALCRLLFAPGDGTDHVQRAAARALVAMGGGSRAMAERNARVFDDGANLDAMLTTMLHADRGPLDATVVFARYAPELRAAAASALRGVPEHARAALERLRDPATFPPFATSAAGSQASDAFGELRESLAELAALSATHADASVRRAAVAMLAGLRSEPAVAALQRAVADSDEAVSTRALAALAALPPTEPIVASIVGRLNAESSWSVRIAAVEALARIASPAATAALMRTLRSDDYEVVRIAAARALAADRSESSVADALREVATGDPAESVRQAAQAALLEPLREH